MPLDQHHLPDLLPKVRDLLGHHDHLDLLRAGLVRHWHALLKEVDEYHRADEPDLYLHHYGILLQPDRPRASRPHALHVRMGNHRYRRTIYRCQRPGLDLRHRFKPDRRGQTDLLQVSQSPRPKYGASTETVRIATTGT